MVRQGDDVSSVGAREAGVQAGCRRDIGRPRGCGARARPVVEIPHRAADVSDALQPRALPLVGRLLPSDPEPEPSVRAPVARAPAQRPIRPWRSTGGWAVHLDAKAGVPGTPAPRRGVLRPIPHPWPRRGQRTAPHDIDMSQHPPPRSALCLLSAFRKLMARVGNVTKPGWHVWPMKTQQAGSSQHPVHPKVSVGRHDSATSRKQRSAFAPRRNSSSFASQGAPKRPASRGAPRPKTGCLARAAAANCSETRSASLLLPGRAHRSCRNAEVK